MNIKILLPAMMLLGANISFATIFTPAQGLDTYPYGFGKKEGYDVAVHIDNPNLVGAKITALRIPLQPDTKVTSAGYSGWLSSQLKAATITYTPDIVKVSATVDGNWAIATLAQPYEIPTEGVFAGYSFTISEIASDADRLPLILANAPEGKNNMWIRSTHSYRAWQDFGNDADVSTALQVVIDEASLPSAAATFDCPNVIYAAQNEATAITIDAVNQGSLPISSIDYAYTIGNQKYEASYTPGTPIGCEYFGESCQLNIPLAPIAECGNIDCTFQLIRVNDSDNLSQSQDAQCSLAVLPFITKHRPLVEEYTGLWCGNCPPGLVGVKMLSERMGDDAVVVSIHNNDPMDVLPTSQYPYKIQGYPDMWFDRIAPTTNVFCGENLNNMFGLDRVCRKYALTVAPCDIEVQADYTDASKCAVKIKTKVRFMYDSPEADYRIGVGLVADDLYNDSWKQTNYLSGNGNAHAIELDEMYNAPGYIFGLHFDDVLVAYGNPAGDSGSLPSNITALEDYEYECTIDISQNQVIQDKNKVRAFAYVVNGATGHIENANKTRLDSVIAGIDDVSPDLSAPISVEYYSLSGQRLTRPNGLCISITRYSDGTTIAKKTLIK